MVVGCWVCGEKLPVRLRLLLPLGENVSLCGVCEEWAESRGVLGMKTFYRTWHFENGFGANVIRNQWSHGGQSGLFELMVTENFGQPCYTSPITDDVVGYLTARQVVMLLRRIEGLVEV